MTQALHIVLDGVATWFATLGGTVIVRTLLREALRDDPDDDPAFDLKIGAAEIAIAIMILESARSIAS
jgi:hypothetical protein